MADVQVGQQAPDFTLPNENGENVTLSQVRGKPVVLVFYPLDFSGTCTSELCGIRDDFSAFQNYGADVYGISRDSVYTHKAFKEANHLAYHLLADMKGTVATAYGCWNAERAIAERMTVVIDKDGKITYVVHNSPANARDHHDAIDSLKALQAA